MARPHKPTTDDTDKAPTEVDRMHTVVTERDIHGTVTETVTVTSAQAASHWDASAWTRVG